MARRNPRPLSYSGYAPRPRGTNRSRPYEPSVPLPNGNPNDQPSRRPSATPPRGQGLQSVVTPHPHAPRDPNPGNGLAGGMGQYVYVTRGGKRVAVLRSKLTPAERAGVNARAGGSTGTGAATTPPAQQTIDPRDGDYQVEAGQSAFEQAQALAEQTSRQSQLASLYNRGLEDIRTAYDRDKYDTNAGLAARGIIRSGEYQRLGANRAMQNTRNLSSLDQQYGSGAQAEIAQRTAEINQRYALAMQAAMQNARNRYMQSNPASQYIWSATQ